jgi:drug/metabolite transporter (DMT)-like permease
MGIFGKLAYDEGVSVGTLLAVRFTIAALLFWGLVAVRGSRSRSLTRRDALIGLALGAGGYSLQAGLYFVALERTDASILGLILFTFPAMVTVAAILLGREMASRRNFAALALTSTGLALVLAGAGTGTFNTGGAVLGFGAAAVYAIYILSSQGVAERINPYLLSALVCTGAAITLTSGSAIVGQLHPAALTKEGWLWLGCIALVSTVAAIGLFFAGLRRAGPTTTSILGAAEPVTTVTLAFLVFRETLVAVQIFGGVLVLAAVVVLQARRRAPGLA